MYYSTHYEMDPTSIEEAICKFRKELEEFKTSKIGKAYQEFVKQTKEGFNHLFAASNYKPEFVYHQLGRFLDYPSVLPEDEWYKRILFTVAFFESLDNNRLCGMLLKHYPAVCTTIVEKISFFSNDYTNPKHLLMARDNRLLFAKISEMYEGV